MQTIIFGPPGVGKGTQAKIISKSLNVGHYSTGDILREAVTNETELGAKAKAIMEEGGLVPDDIMAGIIKDVLESDECKNGFILDGFPRTEAQARLLASILSDLNFTDIKVIKLETNSLRAINKWQV